MQTIFLPLLNIRFKKLSLKSRINSVASTNMEALLWTKTSRPSPHLPPTSAAVVPAPMLIVKAQIDQSAQIDRLAPIIIEEIRKIKTIQEPAEAVDMEDKQLEEIVLRTVKAWVFLAKVQLTVPNNKVNTTL
jgi:hypothetical protein